MEFFQDFIISNFEKYLQVFLIFEFFFIIFGTKVLGTSSKVWQ